VPSCPQKQSGSSAKRQTMPPPGLVRDESEEIRPRTLDLDDTDPIESLSLSPMNMASPGEHGKAREGSSLSGIDHSMVNARPVRDVANVRQPPEAIAGSRENAKRVKRNDEMDPFLERQNACENLDYLRFSVPVPLAANRANSMADTKMLFTRQDGLCQTESFCALPGAEHQFTFEDHFDWLYKLGSGSFCDVYAVEHKTRKGERYAIKYSKREFKSRNERAEHLKEVQLACKMPVHSNVVEYFRAWQESYVFYVQMELCANGTLRHLLTRDGHTLKLPGAESRVWEMTTHIARGLAHIHSYEVMHCDLKPDNILISGDGVFKIGDLGHATGLKAWDEQEGDACYLSRDLLEARPSTAADIFSFGIMLYEIKTAEELPGSGPHWEYLRSGQVPPPAGCGARLAPLIQAMMSPYPEARPTADHILQGCCAAAADAALAAALAGAAGGTMDTR